MDFTDLIYTDRSVNIRKHP